MIASEETLNKIKRAAVHDDEYQMLRNQILTGWPDSISELPKLLRAYHTFADELSISDDFVFKGSCIVVPSDVRTDMLDRIHSSHIGINGCIRRAREALFWPGMAKQIHDSVGRCRVCQEYETNIAKEPLMSHEVST